MTRLKLSMFAASLAAGISILLFFAFAPEYLERQQNRVGSTISVPVSPRAASLHDDLFIVDLHSDALLWRRDLLHRSSYGHTDIPRLTEANVAIQAFTVVTRVPMGRNLTGTPTDGYDLITPLAVAQRWPVRTWSSLMQRALFEAAKLRRMAERSDGKLALIRSRNDLEVYLRNRRKDRIVGGFLGLEGAHALEGKLENLDILYAAGFRMLGLLHHFDSEIGGSSTGEGKGGLTAFGRDVVRRADELGMIIDLAHASPAVIDDVLTLVTRPVVVSHTGVRGTCDNNRNLRDSHIRGIARNGGVIGIGYWPAAICGNDVQSIARAVRYVSDLVGTGHVALGSDFDGAIEAPFDVTGLAQVTEMLVTKGFSDADIRKIMGENTLRILSDAVFID